MNIHYMSDLHLEFSSLTENPKPSSKDSILVLAGDIFTSRCKYGKMQDIFNMDFEKILMIAGNHEFYDGNIQNEVLDIKQLIEELGYDKKIIYLDNEVFEQNDVVFIGSTLWSDFDWGKPTVMEEARMYMNDYSIINNGSNVLNPEDILEKFNDNVRFLKNQLERVDKEKKVVVITHNPPTYRCVEQKFKGDSLNGAFVSDLHDVLKSYKIDYWICGHVHSSHDFILHETNIVCNPRGYATHEINENFDINKKFSI